MLTATVVPAKSTASEVHVDAGLADPVGPAELEDAGDVPPLGEPGRRVRGQRERVGAVGMDEEGDGRHRRAAAQPAGAAGGRCPSASDTAAVNRAAASPASCPGTPLRACTRNSTLPAEPVRGEAIAPMMPVPASMQRGRHPLERAQPERGVPDDALAPGDGGPARLELGLDQEDEVGVGRRHRAGERGHDAAQRDEGEIGHHERAGLVGGVGRTQLRQR